jgi:hypothetical protein
MTFQITPQRDGTCSWLECTCNPVIDLYVVLLEILNRPMVSLATREDRSPIAGEKHYAGFQFGVIGGTAGSCPSPRNRLASTHATDIRPKSRAAAGYRSSCSGTNRCSARRRRVEPRQLVGNVIAPVGAALAVVMAVVAYSQGRGVARWAITAGLTRLIEFWTSNGTQGVQ